MKHTVMCVQWKHLNKLFANNVRGQYQQYQTETVYQVPTSDINNCFSNSQILP